MVMDTDSGRLAGRVGLVTGGASGIGEGAVRRLVKDGARVVIADVQQERGTALAQELGDACRYANVDVAEERSVAAAIDVAVDEFGRLDIAFANAGILGATGSILNSRVDDVRRTFEVDLLGVYITIKHAARVMVEQRSGVILATGSPAALAGGVGPHAYSAAKAGVISLVRSVAAELRPYGVRVNSIIPGSVVSAMTADIVIGDADDIERARRSLSDESLMERPIDPSDIANAVSFLASDEAAFITGHALAVDAGMTGIAGQSPFTTGEWSEPQLLQEAGRRS